MRFVNLTGDHAVVIHNKSMGEQELVAPPSGNVARIDSKLIRVTPVTDDCTGVTVKLIAFIEPYVYGLPEPKEGVIYIVSEKVRRMVPYRCDVASPDVTSKDCEWDGNKVRAVPGLVVNAKE